MNIKLNIIEQIELLRSNKKCYNDIEEYNYKLNQSYIKLSNCIKEINNKEINNEEMNDKEINDEEMNDKEINDEEIYDEKIYNKEIYNELLLNTIKINCFTIKDVLAFENIRKISDIFPLFDLYLIENKFLICENKNFCVQTIPILNDYDKLNILSNIKFLLYLCDISQDSKSKIIVIIMLYDELFKNFKFLLDNKKFYFTIEKKINDFLNNKNDEISKINDILEKYNLDINLFNIWKKFLDVNNNYFINIT